VRASIPAKGWLQQPNPTPDQQLTLLPPPLIRPRHEYDRLEVGSGAKLVFCVNHHTVPTRESGDVDWSRVTRVRILSVECDHG